MVIFIWRKGTIVCILILYKLGTNEFGMILGLIYLHYKVTKNKLSMSFDAN